MLALASRWLHGPRVAIVLLGPWLLLAVGCEQSKSAASNSKPASLPTASIAAGSPRAFLARSIEAYGGERNIARLQIGRVEMVGRGAFVPGVSGQFTVVDTFDLPRRLRREADFSDGKIALKILTVIDGDRAWTKTYGEGQTDGVVRELASPAGKNNAFPHSVLGSLIEMCDPAVTLKRVPCDEPSQTWISVGRDNQQFGTNVFENRTGHILGTIKQVADPAVGAIAVRTVYSNYRTVSGIDVPMQMASYRENDLIMELKIVKLDILPAVDERLFARPN
jgi:hypothetical protein